MMRAATAAPMSGRSSSGRAWEREVARRVDAGASQPPPTWRIGITAPAHPMDWGVSVSDAGEPTE